MSCDTEPQTFKQLASDPIWIEAMEVEIKDLQDNHTWYIIKIPEGKRLMGCNWMFKIKYKSTGEAERFKARLVAKGYNQKRG